MYFYFLGFELIEVNVEIHDADDYGPDDGVDEQIDAPVDEIQTSVMQMDYKEEPNVAPDYSQRNTNRKSVKQDQLNAEVDALESEIAVLQERYRLFKLNEVGINTLNLKKAAVATLKKQIKRLESKRIAAIRHREKTKSSKGLTPWSWRLNLSLWN